MAPMEAVVTSDSSGGAKEALDLSPANDYMEAVPPVAVATAGRAEIDTSAPFESVKEAVNRFGGSAVWKSQLKQHLQSEKLQSPEVAEIVEVEEQAAQIEKDLIEKERETLEVLKELEMTKKIIDELKLRIQKETSKGDKMATSNSYNSGLNPILEAEEDDHGDQGKVVFPDDLSVASKQPAGLILMELKQAKVNLSRTTNNLADIRASIELLNRKLDDEKLLLEKTREKLTQDAATAVSLEQELNQATENLQKAQSPKDPSCSLQEIGQITSEIELSRKVSEAAKKEVIRLASEIEQTKASIKTAEIRCLAAKKMGEAAKAVEAVALAEIRALKCSNISSTDLDNSCAVTLSVEEYTDLLRKAQEADELSRNKIEFAMQDVDEATRSKTELMMKIEDATAEVITSKRELEDALVRVEAANKGKTAVEEALRRWRSERSQKRRNLQNSTQFKNSAALHRRDSHLVDLNGSALLSDVPTFGLRPPMSIGQILSMKLMGPEESYDDTDGEVGEKENQKPNVSLGQMLNRKHTISSTVQSKNGYSCKPSSANKRKKLGFVGFSLLLAKQSNRNIKKRQSLDTR